MIERRRRKGARPSPSVRSWGARLAWPCLAIALALSAACDREPELLGEHLRRGDEALADGRYAQALAAYGHAREIAPASARVQRAQMWAHVLIMADSPARIGPESLEDVAYEAELQLAAAGGDKSRQAVCLAALGNLLARKGDFEAARAKLEEATKADPASAVAHAALGTLLLGRPDQLAAAKAELALALKSKPDSVAALAAMGRVRLAEGDLQGAAEQLEATLRKSDDPLTRIAIGNARLQQHRFADAADHFQRAATLDPRSADALSGLGQARLGEGKLDEAERALRAALQLRQDEQTLVALGFSLVRSKKADQALSLFAQVLAQDPAAAPALYGMGLASEDLGRTDQALDDYRRLLALPAEGPQKAVIAEVQKGARDRMSALASAQPSVSASASASAAASAPRPPAPAPRSPVVNPLLDRR